MRRAVRDGRISLIDGKIDPVAADAQWSRNTRVRAGSRPTDDANLVAGGTPASRDDEDSTTGYWTAKSKREAAEAEIAELKLAELQGNLVRADAVRAAMAKRVAAVREALLQLPARVVPLLVADSSPAAMDHTLRTEIVAALANLTEAD
ncbi:MAG: hypothetical protein IPM99_18735 [Rubrivivax sp.]|nr:hypothetical protein [Rubrivivax sp.]